MKKLLTILSIAVVTAGSAFAANFEYPYIYKDPAVMGMGGAYTAVGGTVNSLFYNPAGLSDVKQSAGFEVTLLKLGVATSSKTKDFYNDLQDVLDIDNDTEQLTALNDLILKYLGENFHFDVETMALGIVKGGETSSFGFTLVGNVQANFATHEGAGTDGLIEVHQYAYGGIIGGYSRKFMDSRLKVGVGAKFFYAQSVDHTFTTSEIVANSDDLSDYIKDNYLETGNGFSFDFGLEYAPMPDNVLHPQIGLSVLNIGDLDFGDAGKIPMSVNLGFALKPEFNGFGGFFKEPVFALDIVDVTHNNGVDDDWGKRIRVGAEIKVWDNRFTSWVVRGGLYEGYPTFGTDFRLGVFNLQFATYAEEVGAYAGQDADRRYTGALSIEW
ncbi:hypothetical protein [Desulfurobacterium sp.]